MIAVVADIHVSLRRDRYGFEEARFNQLIQHLESQAYDYIILAGDVFDRARPTLEEVHLVYSGIERLTKRSTVYLLAGNHEAVSLTESLYKYLPPPCQFVENEEITLYGHSFRFIDWFHKEKYQNYHADVLISHVRCQMPGLYDEEVDTSAFIGNYQKVILGDIHSRYKPYLNTYYTGQPYSSTFGQTGRKTGYITISPALDIQYVDLELGDKIELQLSLQEFKQYGFRSKNRYRVTVRGSKAELVDLEAPLNVELIKLTDQVIVEQVALSKRLPLLDDVSGRVAPLVNKPVTAVRQALQGHICE